jgi:hypothetical protein
MNKENIAIALTDEACDLLEPFLVRFKSLTWTKDKERPICILCEHADFSGHLVEVHVLLKDKTKAPHRMWIPHSYVALAFDFSESKAIGFVH